MKKTIFRKIISVMTCLCVLLTVSAGSLVTAQAKEVVNVSLWQLEMEDDNSATLLDYMDKFDHKPTLNYENHITVQEQDGSETKYDFRLIAIGDGALKNKNLQTVTLGEGIVSIGAEAFADNPELTSVNIPASVTEIGKNAFANCPQLSLICYYNTAGYTYAAEHNIPCEVRYHGECSLDFGEIKILENGSYMDPELPEGVSYDLEKNVLKLKDVNIDDSIAATHMSDDFTVQVEGSCTLDQLYLGYIGNAVLEGTGTLTLNSQDRQDALMIINCSQFTVQCAGLTIPASRITGILCDQGDAETQLNIRSCRVDITGRDGGYGISMDYSAGTGKEQINIADSDIFIHNVFAGIDTQRGNLSVKNSTIQIDVNYDNGFGIAVGWYDDGFFGPAQVYGGKLSLDHAKIRCSLNGREGYSLYYYDFPNAEEQYFYTGTEGAFAAKSYDQAIQLKDYYRFQRYELENEDLIILPEPLSETGTVVYGDLDQNGIPDASDALAILRSAAKLTELTAEQQLAGDVDESGSVDAADALLVLKKAAKLIDFFPPMLKEAFDVLL